MSMPEHFPSADNIQRFGALKAVLFDSDVRGSQTTRSLLSTLGLTQVSLSRTPDETLRQLKAQPVDVVIIDAGAAEEGELAFIRQLRRASGQYALIPVITLSNQTSPQDIDAIMEAGSNEVVAKPTSARSLYMCLQSIVDQPRAIIITESFVGPDRRSQLVDGEVDERRTAMLPNPIARQEYGGVSPENGIQVILPDFSLKMKVNTAAGMSRKKMEDEFIFASLSDLGVLEAAHIHLLNKPESSAAALERISTTCMAIRARAVSFGYQLASRVAGLLNDFCRTHYQPGHSQHAVVVEKHIATLSTVFHRRLGGDGGAIGHELLSELVLLVKRFS